jgi:tetraacyldisaccharide 4'-kinase
MKNLKRADVIVITRADLVDPDEAIFKKVTAINSAVPIFRCHFQIKEFRPLAMTPDRPEYNAKENAFAFCGLGNPKNFYESLKQKGVNLAGEMSFPDHHFYKSEDILEIEKAAENTGSRNLVTTPKDAVKLQSRQFSIPCFIAEIETVIDDPVRFRDLVLSA